MKRSAATQIGQVVSAHPEEVELILDKVTFKRNEEIIQKRDCLISA